MAIFVSVEQGPSLGDWSWRLAGNWTAGEKQGEVTEQLQLKGLRNSQLTWWTETRIRSSKITPRTPLPTCLPCVRTLEGLGRASGLLPEPPWGLAVTIDSGGSQICTFYVSPVPSRLCISVNISRFPIILKNPQMDLEFLLFNLPSVINKCLTSFD